MNSEKISSPDLANDADQVPSAQVVSLRELSGNGSGTGLFEGNLGLISGVKVRVEVMVGSAELSIAQLFELKKDSVMPLEQLHNAPLSVRLEGKTIALGTLVVVGDNFGVHITEITPLEAAASA